MTLIDLSHKLDNVPTYPGDLPFILKKEKSLVTDGYNLISMSSAMHTGTHIDFPMHLVNDNKTCDEFELDWFYGEGALINAEGKKQITGNDCVFNDKKIVLIYTGFDKYFYDDFYFTEHPIITESAADCFIDKKIKILGLDFPSPDYFPFEIHKKLLENNILIIENLTNVASLLGKEFNLISFPLKVKAEASLIRAVAEIK